MLVSYCFYSNRKLHPLPHTQAHRSPTIRSRCCNRNSFPANRQAQCFLDLKFCHVIKTGTFLRSEFYRSRQEIHFLFHLIVRYSSLKAFLLLRYGCPASPYFSSCYSRNREEFYSLSANGISDFTH